MIRRDFIDILGEFEGDYVTRQHIVAHGAEKGIRHCIWCGRGTCVWYNNWFVAQYIIYHKHWPLITCCIYVEELHISDMNNIVWWSLYIAWRRSVVSCCRAGGIHLDFWSCRNTSLMIGVIQGCDEGVLQIYISPWRRLWWSLIWRRPYSFDLVAVNFVATGACYCSLEVSTL